MPHRETRPAPPAPQRTIARQPLREQIYDELLRRIDEGTYPPATRLRDVALAADLGVSRTPVRETLLRLEREGVVLADQGYGFAVRALSVEEVRDKYPILWTLEALALDCAPLPGEARLAELREVNAAMARAEGDPARLLALDTEWHTRLLADCPNATLLELIATLKASLRRYELAFMRGAGRAAASAEHHARVLDALAAGDRRAARQWLERNWAQSLEQLAAWLADGPRRGS